MLKLGYEFDFVACDRDRGTVCGDHGEPGDQLCLAPVVESPGRCFYGS